MCQDQKLSCKSSHDEHKQTQNMFNCLSGHHCHDIGDARKQGIPETVLGGNVLVLIEDHLSDASLDDELGTLIAGEHGDIDGSTRKRGRVFSIEYRVGLCMHNIGVLGLQLAPICCYFGPGQASIMATPWKAVVPNAKNDLVSAHNACSNLQVTHSLTFINCLKCADRLSYKGLGS